MPPIPTTEIAPRPRKARGVKADAAATGERVAFALRSLARRGVLTAKATRKVSARLDPGLIEAARLKLGRGTDTEVLTAALAVLAGGDDFGAWLVGRAGVLPEDFELGF